MGGRRVDYDRMSELDGQRKSAAEIAAALGCDVRTVTRWRRDVRRTQPLAPHQGHRLTPERLTQAQALLDDGASLSEVRRTLGTTFRTLHHHFPGHNGWTYREGGQLGAWITHAMNTNRKAAA